MPNPPSSHVCTLRLVNAKWSDQSRDVLEDDLHATLLLKSQDNINVEYTDVTLLLVYYLYMVVANKVSGAVGLDCRMRYMCATVPGGRRVSQSGEVWCEGGRRKIAWPGLSRNQRLPRSLYGPEEV